MYSEQLSGFSDEISSDIEIQFETLNKLGISYFEPRGVNNKNISELNDEEVECLKETMKRYNIKVSSIGSPIGKIKVSDDFEKHFELFQRVVRTAKMLNARYIRIFSFYHDGGDWSEAERTQVLVRLKRMVQYAEEQDVVLLHENEKDIYGDVAERCVDLMKELYCEHFQAVFDPANFVQSGEDTKEAFELLKPYITYMHIKDAMASDGSVVPSGYGDGNVAYILEQLYQEGYKGFLSLEPHLGSFQGLDGLELDDHMLNLPPGGEGTFTLAYHALHNILQQITGGAK